MSHPLRARPLRASLAFVALGATGCGARASSLPAAAQVHDLSGSLVAEAPPLTSPRARGDDQAKPRLRAPRRPLTSVVASVDYAALPVMVDAPVAGFVEGSSFELTMLDRTSTTCPPSSLPRQKLTWAMTGLPAMTTVVRLGGTTLPPVRALDGTFEDLDGTLRAVRALRRDSSERLDSDWLSIDATHESRSALTVTRFEGTFDVPRGRGTAARSGKVRARAIVPGTLYAYRRCAARCDEAEGSASRAEEIQLVGPPAIWIGSTGPTERQGVRDDQPFTEGSVVVTRGSSASLSLAVTREALAKFRGAAASVTEPAVVTYSLDVVWSGSDEPEINLFSSTFDDASELVAEKIVLAPEPACQAYGLDIGE